LECAGTQAPNEEHAFSSASVTSDKKHNFFASSRLGENKIIEGLPAKGRLRIILAKPQKAQRV
jgi:hypothetical protein